MADAAVEFLLENLKQLLLYHAKLIQDAQSHVELLENDLRMFRAFLKEHSTQKRSKETLKEFVRQIREVVYEAEDVVDSFVTQAAEAKARKYFAKAIHGPAKLLNIAKEIEEIRVKVKNIYDQNRRDFATRPIDNAYDKDEEDKTFERIKVSGVREDNIVGFDDEAETIINYLKEEKKELDVISIIGMPGLGKTTLAGKIFRDPKVLYEFPKRIWVNVSQEFNRKDVFLAILSNFTTIDDKREKTDHEIEKILCAYLETIKFLIVMDDVWTAEAWTELRDAFPKFNTTGKILVTSRNEEVAKQANRDRDAHKLRLLTPEEGWELLQLEVFGKPECPDDLTTFGELIVERCGRLPLAIVVIGGILVKKASFGDIGAMKITWRKVSESTNTYLNDESGKRMENIISWSYNKLPYYLRPCFLYLGMFPEDFEIPVWKLVHMWIAEGFVQPKKGISLEQTAQDYLEDLINRNLVMVEKVSPDGKIKTCRIHDMLREFCRNEAGSEKENFFQEMKKPGGGAFEPKISEIEKFRRLCLHSNVMSFISSKPYGPRIRSFLCFSKEEIILQRENISFIPEAFKLLRVLEAESFNFQKFPSDLKQLVHLRYIALSSNFKILPDAISKLWNLQTLIVYTSSRTLEIKADIWNMVQLRHVKTNASAILPKPSKSTKDSENLQTLGAISHDSCTEDVFIRIRTLRKLGIRGRLAKLLDAKGLEKLDNLEKLKLVNDAYPAPASEGPLRSLPQPYKFPPKLRSLTLTATFLDWHNMSTLGMLDSLEVLKLKNNAFTGESWKATEGHFQHLDVLHIERTDLVIWTASGHHFPRLRCLVLWNCEKLRGIPADLGQNLQKLDLKRVSKPVADSARKIEKAKKEQQEREGLKRGGFKLICAPADES